MTTYHDKDGDEHEANNQNNNKAMSMTTNIGSALCCIK